MGQRGPKSSRPSREVLVGLLERHTLQSVGEMYGVTKERVRQWLQIYGIESVFNLRPAKAHQAHPCKVCEKPTGLQKIYCTLRCKRKDSQKPLVHGTSHGYNGHRCRCEECRKWNAGVMQKRIRANKELKELPLSCKHGTLTTYQYWGCRCTICKAEGGRKCREYKNKRKLAAG